MPNWCEGNIRFRGTKDNIKQFLLNEVVCCRMDKNYETVQEKPEVKDDDYLLVFSKPNGKSSWFYFKGTRRNFIESETIEVWFDDDDEGKEIIICIDNFKAAWSFEYVDAWKEHAKKYSIDVKLTGYDRGMMFSQIKTISKDGIVKETIKEYETWEEWMWNCPQPNNGG